MLVDNSIVVLENIDRHRSMGKQGFAACYEGTKEVWGAVFASTVTTVAVFVPVIFIQEESGQLFRDIAIAITFSIILSLFVSVGVIPAILNQFYKARPVKNNNSSSSHNDIIGKIGGIFANAIMLVSDLFLKNIVTRLACIIIFTLMSIFLAAWLIPKAEYLPQGNRNLVLGILIPPPGASVEKRKAIGDYVYEQADPNMKADNVNGIPQIKDMFYVASPDLNLIGAISTHDTEVGK